MLFHWFFNFKRPQWCLENSKPSDLYSRWSQDFCFSNWFLLGSSSNYHPHLITSEPNFLMPESPCHPTWWDVLSSFQSSASALGKQSPTHTHSALCLQSSHGVSSFSLTLCVICMQTIPQHFSDLRGVGKEVTAPVSTLVSGGILPSILIVYMLHITQLCPNIVIPICLNVWAHSLASLFLCNFNSFDISMSMLRCSFIYHRFKITLIPCTIWTYVTSILPFVLLYLGRDLRLCQKRTAITTRLN